MQFFVTVPGDADGLFSGSDEVAMETVEMRDGENETKWIDDDPKQIDDVVPVGRLNEGTGRMEGRRFDVVGQGTRDESWTQINGNGREPDHGDAEKDAMRSVE